MDTIRVIYTGGQPELLTDQGHRIIRNEPIALPIDMASVFLKERPDEFQKAEV